MPAAPVLRLHQPSGSPAVIKGLEEELVKAKAADLVGYVVIWIYRGEYAIDVRGEARRRPLLMRGLLPELYDKLRAIIRAAR